MALQQVKSALKALHAQDRGGQPTHVHGTESPITFNPVNSYLALNLERLTVSYAGEEEEWDPLTQTPLPHDRNPWLVPSMKYLHCCQMNP